MIQTFDPTFLRSAIELLRFCLYDGSEGRFQMPIRLIITKIAFNKNALETYYIKLHNLHIFIYVFIFIYKYISIYIYTYLYMYIYISIDAFIYVYMHI